MDIQGYRTKMQAAVERLEEELKKVRTGRAHPSMLDGIMVEAYGAHMPLKSAANITAPEPQLLQVTPFDPTNLQAIATAIREDQSLGLNPSDDGRVVRIPMPPLTEERRRQIVKALGDIVEETRVALRNIRHEALKDAKQKKDAKEISEDDAKRFDAQLTEAISEYNGKIEAASSAKESDIMSL